MTASLLFALVCVYVLSIAGIVVVGRLVETPEPVSENLEQRLARIRAVQRAHISAAATPADQYFVPAKGPIRPARGL